MEKVKQNLSEKLDNKYIKYLSDISYYSNDTIGLAKPENKFKIFAANILSLNLYLDECNVIELVNENEIESLLNKENVYISIFPTFKLNGKVYDFNKKHEQILDADEINKLLDENKVVVIFNITLPLNNVIKYRTIILDAPIQIYCEQNKNEYYTETLDEITTSLNSGEETLTVSNIKKILKKVINHDYNTGSSLKLIKGKPVDSEIAKEGIERFKEYTKIFNNENHLDFTIFGRFAMTLDFINNDDPFDFLDILDKINIDKFYNRVDESISDSIYDEFIEKYEKLVNNPITINKKKIYSKWEYMNLNIQGISKYKVANYFEVIDLLIKSYNILNVKTINRKTCINTTMLVIMKLTNDFNPYHFFDKYCYAITEKFDNYVNEEFRLTGKLGNLISNSDFISEFITQYIDYVKPKINLIKSE